MLQKLFGLVAWYDDYIIDVHAGHGKYAIVIRDTRKGDKIINDNTYFDTLEYAVASAYKSFIDYVAEDKGYGVLK